ncbi:MAG: hypothetical protein QM673_03345 [Gordonia sp. (in: high G+C Gram-positive bacteria)]
MSPLPPLIIVPNPLGAIVDLSQRLRSFLDKPELPSEETLFDITPSELDQIVATWRQQVRSVKSIDFTPMSEVIGTASTVMTALRGMAAPATQASTSIQHRLAAMAEALDDFISTSTSSDAAAAAVFDHMAGR